MHVSIFELPWDPNSIICLWVPNNQRPNDFWESNLLTNSGLFIPAFIRGSSRRLMKSYIWKNFESLLKKGLHKCEVFWRGNEEKFIGWGNNWQQREDNISCSWTKNMVRQRWAKRMEKGFSFIGRRWQVPVTWIEVESRFDCLENILWEYLMRFPDCQLDIHPKFPKCQLLALEFW